MIRYFPTLKQSLPSAIFLAAALADAADPPLQPRGVMEEIVVSAQRREESLNDVPLSVTALSQSMLKNAGIDSSRDLAMVTPGLVVDAVGAWVQPAIRGVTTTVTGTTEANVATYIDGIYQATQVGAHYEMPDIRQVEVLKGPQGTLFGRNSTGGAILIHTLQPDLSETNGSLSLGYSSFDTYTAKAFVAIPLLEDKAAISVSTFYENMNEGYLEDLWNGGKTGTTETGMVRAKLRFLPWEGADFTLAVMYSDRKDGTGLATTNWQGHNAQIVRGAAEGIPIATKAHELASDVKTMVNPETTSLSLSGDIELGLGTLSFTTAYMENELWMIIDGDGSPYPFSRSLVDSNYEVFTQEIIYSADLNERLHAIGGLYYYKKNAFQLYASTSLDGSGNWTNDDLALGIWTNDEIEAYAGFGQLSYDLTDKLNVSLGLRYSHETATAFAHMNMDADVRPNIEKLGSQEWDSVDPRVSFVYSINDESNVYFTYSQGFKSGIFNNSALQTEPVDPEKVDAYEIGYKGVIGPTLSLSAAAFYYDYADLQQTTIQFDPVLNLLRQQLSNAASVEIKGVEVNAAWQITDRLSFTFGAQYLDADYKDHPEAVVNIPQSPGLIVPTPIDASGNRMVRAPEWTGSLTALYELETAMGNLAFAGTLFGSSEYFLDSGNRVTQPAHAKLNANITWQPLDSALELRLWGKNLTDSDTLTSLISSTAYDAVTYAPPRSFGVEIGYEF